MSPSVTFPKNEQASEGGWCLSGRIGGGEVPGQDTCVKVLDLSMQDACGGRCDDVRTHLSHQLSSGVFLCQLFYTRWFSCGLCLRNKGKCEVSTSMWDVADAFFLAASSHCSEEIRYRGDLMSGVVFFSYIFCLFLGYRSTLFWRFSDHLCGMWQCVLKRDEIPPPPLCWLLSPQSYVPKRRMRCGDWRSETFSASSLHVSTLASIMFVQACTARFFSTNASTSTVSIDWKKKLSVTHYYYMNTRWNSSNG